MKRGRSLLLLLVVVALISVTVPSVAFGYTIVGTKVSGNRSLRSTIYYSNSQDATRWHIDKVICSEATSGGVMKRKIDCSVYTYNEFTGVSNLVCPVLTSPTYTTSAISYTFYPNCNIIKDAYNVYYVHTYVRNNYYANGVMLSTYVNMP